MSGMEQTALGDAKVNALVSSLHEQLDLYEHGMLWSAGRAIELCSDGDREKIAEFLKHMQSVHADVLRFENSLANPPKGYGNGIKAICERVGRIRATAENTVEVLRREIGLAPQFGTR